MLIFYFLCYDRNLVFDIYLILQFLRVGPVQKSRLFRRMVKKDTMIHYNHVSQPLINVLFYN